MKDPQRVLFCWERRRPPSAAFPAPGHGGAQRTARCEPGSHEVMMSAAKRMKCLVSLCCWNVFSQLSTCLDIISDCALNSAKNVFAVLVDPLHLNTSNFIIFGNDSSKTPPAPIPALLRLRWKLQPICAFPNLCQVLLARGAVWRAGWESLKCCFVPLSYNKAVIACGVSALQPKSLHFKI